jgi:antitoxin (DNA-binding transcriptional repressor) of toxin-antitoxin stability system
MKTVELDAAGTDLHSLVEEAAAGEEIIFEKSGKPMARLTQFDRPGFHRAIGALKGRIEMTDDFDAPLPPEIAKAFGIEE